MIVNLHPYNQAPLDTLVVLMLSYYDDYAYTPRGQHFRFRLHNVDSNNNSGEMKKGGDGAADLDGKDSGEGGGDVDGGALSDPGGDWRGIVIGECSRHVIV